MPCRMLPPTKLFHHHRMMPRHTAQEEIQQINPFALLSAAHTSLSIESTTILRAAHRTRLGKHARYLRTDGQTANATIPCRPSAYLPAVGSDCARRDDRQGTAKVDFMCELKHTARIETRHARH